jgi:hypothetical protein
MTTFGGGVTSYLVASSPEVLTHILRDNESRGIEFNPALYTTPACAMNTAKVDFAPPAASFAGGQPPPSPSGRHRPPGGPSAGRSLPGSAHSTLSRGHSSSSPGSLEMAGGRRPVRRKASFVTSGCQVMTATSSLLAACELSGWCMPRFAFSTFVPSESIVFMCLHSFPGELCFPTGDGGVGGDGDGRTVG